MTTTASSLPQTTSAIQIDTQGPSSTLTYRSNVPLPQPKKGEILVRNTYAGVNYIDTYFRSGLYASPTGLPLTLGREAEGHIVSLGDGAAQEYGFKIGDRVAYTGWFTYATYTCVPAFRAISLSPFDEGEGKSNKIPEGIGAASIIQGLTGLTLIHESYAAKEGDFVLVHAAGGGMGLILTQLLRRIGVRVIATASSKEKLEVARKAGAEFLVDYSNGQNWVEKVKEILKREGREEGGVDCVYDGVGKVTFDGDIEVLARKGTLVSYGNASGAVEPLDILRLAPKNLKVTRPQLFGFIETREEFLRYATELFTLLAKGELKIQVHKVYDWEELDQAHKDITSRGTTGKLLLKIKQEN